MLSYAPLERPKVVLDGDGRQSPSTGVISYLPPPNFQDVARALRKGELTVYTCWAPALEGLEEDWAKVECMLDDVEL